MMTKFFKEEKDNRGVMTITLNRPDLHNAFNDVFIDELIACFSSLSNDDELRLVVLTGAGRSFCAGADLNWMKKMKNYSDEQNYQDSVKLAMLFEAIDTCPVPVIAKVNGAALGGGTGLIAVCDYAIACQSAKLGFTEVCLGLVPAVISPFVIARIGINNARAYFLSGERFLAITAKRIGLIHHVCPLDDLDDQTDKIVKRFLKAGPNAAREAKSLIFGVQERMSLSRDEMRKYTCETIARVRTSDEGQEGMTALLEKRSPSWKGSAS
jgi:methylglutaconyl-CoA hydratase